MPDAPRPTYDSHGNLVGGWAVGLSYDPAKDELSLYWRQAAGPYHAAKNGTETYDPRDLEDAIAALDRRVRILGARRLF